MVFVVRFLGVFRIFLVVFLCLVVFRGDVLFGLFCQRKKITSFYL